MARLGLRSHRLWAFLQNNGVSLVTVLAGLCILFLYAIGLANINVAIGSILALVVLLSTSEVLDRRCRLSELQENSVNILKALNDYRDELAVQYHSPQAAFRRMHELYSTSASIIMVSAEPRRSGPSDEVREYEEALRTAATTRGAEIKWIAHFDGKTRASRALTFLFGCEASNRVVVKRFRDRPNLPIFSFIVFDGRILFTRAPYTPGGRSEYIEVESKGMARLFLDYFDFLFDHAEEMPRTPDTRTFLNNICSQSGGS